jgi:hypothetical protein
MPVASWHWSPVTEKWDRTQLLFQEEPWPTLRA